MEEAQQQAAIKIPEPPAIMPAEDQEKWRQTYRLEYSEAKSQRPHEDEKLWAREALSRANRLLATPRLGSYEEAKKLAGWMKFKESEDGGVLKLVTIDAKKYSFPAPRAVAQ